MADKRAMETQRPRYKNTVHLWEFLMELLEDKQYSSIICWTRKDHGEFKLKNQEEVARRWGKIKQRSGMTYDKLSRALRYYYQKDIIKKVPEQRLVYRFHKLPYEYRPIKCRRDMSPDHKRQPSPDTAPPTITSGPALAATAPAFPAGQPLEIGHRLSAFRPACTRACISGGLCHRGRNVTLPHLFAPCASQIFFPPSGSAHLHILENTVCQAVKRTSVPTKVIQTRTG